MAGWKTNKLVGIVAGVVFIISMLILAMQVTRKPALPPGVKAAIPATPSNTPYSREAMAGGGL